MQGKENILRVNVAGKVNSLNVDGEIFGHKLIEFVGLPLLSCPYGGSSVVSLSLSTRADNGKSGPGCRLNSLNTGE